MLHSADGPNGSGELKQVQTTPGKENGTSITQNEPFVLLYV